MLAAADAEPVEVTGLTDAEGGDVERCGCELGAEVVAASESFSVLGDNKTADQ